MSTPVRTYSRKKFATNIYLNQHADSQNSSQESFSSQENLLDDVLDPFSHRTLFDEGPKLDESEFKEDTETTTSTTTGGTIFDNFDAIPAHKKRKTNYALKLREEKRNQVVNPKKLNKSDIIEQELQTSSTITRDETEFTSIKETLEYILTGFQFLEEPEDKKRKLSLSREIALITSNVTSLLKLSKQKPKIVGQLLRSTPSLFEKLIKILNYCTSASHKGNDVIQLCCAGVIYFLFQHSTNSEYATQECIQICLKIATPSKEENFPKANEDQFQKVLTMIYGPKYRSTSTGEEESIKLALKSLIQLMGVGSQDNEIREKLRTSGILENTLNIAVSLFKSIKRKKLKDDLKMADLCAILKLLEDSTFMNSENANFLLRHKDFLKNMRNYISEEDTSSVECLVLVVKVLINLSHDNETGDAEIGSWIPDIMSFMSSIESAATQLELFPLVIVLLINLVETNSENREKFEISFILKLFNKCERVTSLKTQQEKEQVVYRSYLALLLGLLAQSKENLEQIKEGVEIKVVTETIEEFVKLQKENCILSQQAWNSYSKVLNHLETIK